MTLLVGRWTDEAGMINVGPFAAMPDENPYERYAGPGQPEETFA